MSTAPNKTRDGAPLAHPPSEGAPSVFPPDYPEDYDVHTAPVEDPPDPEKLWGEPSRLREVLLKEAARGLLREYLRLLDRVRMESPEKDEREQRLEAMHRLLGAVEFFADTRAHVWQPEALRRELEADDLPPVLRPGLEADPDAAPQRVGRLVEAYKAGGL